MPEIDFSDSYLEYAKKLIENALCENDADIFMTHIAKVLSEVTDLIGIAMSPSFERGIFDRLEIVNLGGSSFLVIISLKSGIVKTINITINRVIPRIKIEQTEATLYSGTIRNPKELQDLQNEVAALKRFLDTLEERQLEAMLATDEATGKNQEAQKILGQYRAQAEKQQASLVQERTQLESQKAAAENQRLGAAKLIAPDDLAVYERLRKERAGVAVSGVKDRACNACGSTLTAALHQAARSPSQLVFCDMCGRILCAS